MRQPDGKLHFSDLKHIDDTPKQFEHKRTHPPEDTLSFRLGRFTHAKWLLGIDPPVWNEPNKEGTGIAPRSKKNLKYQEMLAQYGEDSVLTDKEYTRVLGMVRALDMHPLACEIKRMCTEFEKPLAWTRNGIECAGYLDMCGPKGIQRFGEGYEFGILAELKSCESRRIAPRSFQKQGEWYHYPEQCGWYNVGNGSLREQIASCLAYGTIIDERDMGNGKYNWPQSWVIAVDSSPPHDVVCHLLGNLRLDQADAKVEVWLEKYSSCVDSGRYPGHAEGPIPWEANIDFGPGDADD